ncbi:Icc protein [Bisgaardia hudsonensis]|uniref:3',5'-cyclic adenosine monophosphate phosphodiesterase CpdA n=1 Tax=Bisgaardia hudsonensis TaxID=109472 RepID=A0A4R2N050_9PAST|nr:3',5'-cyclic-AMP phosphodiesterase [Bisgaardia hudsonensis]QLB13329.1 3',5'-cyclic-AMP phosphodiesterase [Bisgaardia hudsonensis]TCP12729.1 Icc protein [Bisgaardia hudsonensis]
MVNTYKYQSSDNIIRLVQVTDPHLFQDEMSELLGINTQASFSQVLQEIQESTFDYDFVLATGDLVQDSSEEGYLRFCQGINKLQKKVFWIPGNHDFQPKMFEILNENQGNISPLKHLLLGDFWQVIMLDSQVFGVSYGELSQHQLDFLHSKLQAYPERYALIVLHHHIVLTNSAWLDQHNLRNIQEFKQIVTKFPNVKGILCGHIHQAVDSEWFGIKMMATPSTCIQFKADSNNFALDAVQPGWREIALYDNGFIETSVKRVQKAVFLPNMLSDGY